MAQLNHELKQRWLQLVEENPRTRIRDAAEILNVSEMELLATDIPNSVVQLEGDFKALMQRLTEVGKVMSLVRNEIAVHELSGIYPALKFNRNPQVGVAMEAIDLRIHFNEYCYAFASKTPQGKNELRSIQFFDKSGQALQKIYLKNSDHIAVWDEIVTNFKAERQQTSFELIKSQTGSRSFVNIDIDQFRQDWAEMEDVHDIARIIRRYGISRHEAVTLVGDQFAKQVNKEAINELMDRVRQQAIACFVFVGNKGITQIYSGTFKKTVAMGAWMNVLDPDFNLHVLNSAVKDIWVVRKPTINGVVTSLEVYDINGKICLQFAPTGTKQAEEPGEWRSLLDGLSAI